MKDSQHISPIYKYISPYGLVFTGIAIGAIAAGQWQWGLTVLVFITLPAVGISWLRHHKNIDLSP